MTQSKPVQYHLEIYDPASDTIAFSTIGQSPLGSFTKGDLIGTMKMPLNERLRVASVEHLYWESEQHIGYKVCIRTEVFKF